MKPMKLMFSVAALTALTAPAFAADFATLDANKDGSVSFSEYRAIAETEGKTTTLAAQEFTRMAQGDAVLTEDEFFLAEALVDQPYALQSIPTSEVLTLDPVENVSTVETFESFPAEVEAIEPPAPVEVQTDVEPEITIEAPIETPVESMDAPAKELNAPVVMEKAMTPDPVVAGEIETSDILEDVTPELTEEPVDVTPMEEGSFDLPEIETPETAPEKTEVDMSRSNEIDLSQDSDIEVEEIK